MCSQGFTESELCGDDVATEMPPDAETMEVASPGLPRAGIGMMVSADDTKESEIDASLACPATQP